MITLICGTNRPKNVSQKFVNLYQTLLSKRNLECNTVAMENIPKDIAFSNDIIGTASGELKSILNEKNYSCDKTCSCCTRIQWKLSWNP